MSAREEILSSIRARKTKRGGQALSYRAPRAANLLENFIAHARGADADVRLLASVNDVPAAIAELLRARNLAAALHLPPDPAFETLPWAGQLTLLHTPPGPDDAALAFAPFAIAETGTLVYPAAKARPASWHFRAGLEIAILDEGAILGQFEDVLAKLKERGLPHTVNLVTGPSRTGDIEQTLELGAHGPKALAILIVNA